MSGRDEFSESVKRTLAQRAAYFCTNPTCRRLTSFPHDEETKALILGRAAHIRAAAPGGPRYDANQAREQRTSITNGIWLCTECAARVDDEASAHPVQLLDGWKTDHSAWLNSGSYRPVLPEIAIVSHEGLRVEPGQPVTAEAIAQAKEYTLRVRNPGLVEVFEVVLDLTMPERLAWVGPSTRPPGVEVHVEERRAPLRGMVQGGGKIEMVGNLPPPRNLRIGVSTLKPGSLVEVPMRTIVQSEDDRFVERLPNLADALIYHIQGSLKSAIQSMPVHWEFIVPIRFDAATRRMWTEPATEDIAKYRVIVSSVWP